MSKYKNNSRNKILLVNLRVNAINENTITADEATRLSKPIPNRN
jgi:hypothetical protein